MSESATVVHADIEALRVTSVAGRAIYLEAAVTERAVLQLLQLPYAVLIPGFGYVALWLHSRREIGPNLHSVRIAVEYKP